MNFFKSGLEYNKLAQSFNGQYMMLQPLIQKSEYEDIQEELFFLAYIGRREIIDRLEEYNWNLSTLIIVPMMPGEKKTITFAYHQTIGKLLELSEKCGCLEKVNEVLNKGEFYYEFDQSIPDSIKNLF